MAVVRLDCSRITDWDSFHSAFAEAFGFPKFYGRNMNAWIDCLSYLDDPGSEMTRITMPPCGVVTLHLEGIVEFAARCPEQYAALVECSAFVNWRRTSNGNPAILALSFYK